jgi:hypothetical protein
MKTINRKNPPGLGTSTLVRMDLRFRIGSYTLDAEKAHTYLMSGAPHPTTGPYKDMTLIPTEFLQPSLKR